MSDLNMLLSWFRKKMSACKVRSALCHCGCYVMTWRSDFACAEATATLLRTRVSEHTADCEDGLKSLNPYKIKQTWEAISLVVFPVQRTSVTVTITYSDSFWSQRTFSYRNIIVYCDSRLQWHFCWPPTSVTVTKNICIFSAIAL